MFRPRSKVARKITAVFAVVGLATSLAVTQAATVTAQDPYDLAIPAVGEKDPTLKKFYDQRIEWGPCHDTAQRSWAFFRYQTYLASNVLECGTVEVPVVYPDVIAQDKALGNPWKVEAGRPTTIKLAVSRVRATGERKGGMLVNPGGPGGSGINTPVGLREPAIAARILENYDIVGFDPRGVGASIPNLRCLTDKQFDAVRTGGHHTFSKADVAIQNQQNQEYIEGCIKEVGATFLAHIGARDVVRDMDIIRSAIGDKKMTYIGYSYGTFLGSQYAEAFPNKIRALVLDGVVDPTEDNAESVINQGAGFQQSFEAWARWCAEEGNCPLGNDPKKATAEFHKLARPLQKKPMFTVVMSRPLGWADAVQGVIAAMYSQSTWPLLKLGLQQLKAGVGGDIMLALSDGYYGRWIDGTYANTQDVFSAVLCMDKDTDVSHAEQIDIQRRYLKAMPFADPGGKIEDVPKELCASWPARNTIKAHPPRVKSNGNIIVVSTTGDPATPYMAGVRLARDMDAPLITYVGEGHCSALRGYACVDKYVGDFIVDKKVHGKHMTCKAAS
ncbi:MAG TPA: alpha/beta hydrolase [Corynebacteriales bacterium]|nr:alpha/beta hydrolase [Mycobacteriales bacterium]